MRFREHKELWEAVLCLIVVVCLLIWAFAQLAR